MTALCEKLELFMDGELSAEETEAFRDHLPTCSACQERFTHLLVLDRLGGRYVKKQPLAQPQPVHPETSFRGRRPRWHYAAMGAAACALAASLVILVTRPPTPGTQELPELAWNPRGRAQGAPRMSDPRVDHYRPVASQFMGGETPPDKLPRAEIARLEEQKDYRALAAVYLAWNRPEQALDALNELDPSSPDVQSDRAAVLISQRKYEDALHVLDPLLTAYPRHRQARWNRALIEEELGLPLLAARDFKELAQQSEEGWAQDAKARAEKLISDAQGRQQRWRAAVEAGEALVSTGSLPQSAQQERTPLLRLYFYDAVRTRTSPEQVLALLPLAKTLDEEAGGEVLQRYVRRISQSDFSQRAPLASEYARLLPVIRKDPAVPALIDRLLRSNEGDLLIGALVWTDTVFQHLEAFEARVRELDDPWFDILAAQQRANADIRAGNFHDAVMVLERARQQCAGAHLTYRCVDLQLDLAHLYARLLQPEEVRQHAREGWNLSRANSLRSKELQFLKLLSTAASLRNDLPVARAYLLESLEAYPGDREEERYVYQNLAHLEIYALNFDRARAAIDQAIATGLPLTPLGASALADIARQRPAPGDEAAMNQAIAAAGPLEKGEHALLLRHLGNFYVERDRVKGRGILRDAIREAEVAGEKDETSRHARTYSYTSLIMDDAKAKDFDEALALFGEELGLEVPRRCVLALTTDTERSLLVVRGADGTTRGYYEGARSQRLPQDLSGFVPQEALSALTPCEKVEALVRPPLQGRSGLLPPSFTWSYRTRREAPRAPQGKPIHLVVMNVQYDRDRNLPPLSWTPAFGEEEDRRTIEGVEATPSRVLRSMEEASEIDLVTHGLVSPISEASYLVLAKEGGAAGTDELRVARIREAKLKGAPLVVLAACDAGRTAPILYEPVSLPNALLKAGARAVLAATRPIPDLEAAGFFNAVRARIRQGTLPAVALREERMSWLQQNRGAEWLDSVLLFE
jgi:CHAT domain-containing protein/putative zinc finger protein